MSLFFDREHSRHFYGFSSGCFTTRPTYFQEMFKIKEYSESHKNETLGMLFCELQLNEAEEKATGINRDTAAQLL